MIFFSATCCKLDMREVVNCGTGMISFIEVPSGNQSLDKHISSYIGYLVCRHEDDECSIAVISKDKGYEAVINHWKRPNINITSFQSIDGAVKEKDEFLMLTVSNANTDSSKKTEFNNQIMKALSKESLSPEIVGKVSSICSKAYGQKNSKQIAYRGIVSDLGQKEGLVAYKLVKQFL